MGRCRCKFSLWGGNFFNNFFHPRHKLLVFLLLILLCIAISFTLCYIILAIYYEAFSKKHSDAYMILFASNLTQILLGVMILHFVTLSPKRTSSCRCIVLYAGIISALILSLAAIIQWNSIPSNEDMKIYITDFFRQYKRVPRIFAMLHRDSKCCGVNNFTDFGTNRETKKIRRIPDSCCTVYKEDCGNFRGKFLNETKSADEIRQRSDRFFLQGCFKNSTFADLGKESPSAYRNHHLIIDWAYLSPIFILSLAICYSYYIFFILRREQPNWVHDEFTEKIMSFTGFSSHAVTTSSSSFAKIHQKVKPKSDVSSITSSASSSVSSSDSKDPSTSISVSPSLPDPKNPQNKSSTP